MRTRGKILLRIAGCAAILVITDAEGKYNCKSAKKPAEQRLGPAFDRNI